MPVPAVGSFLHLWYRLGRAFRLKASAFASWAFGMSVDADTVRRVAHLARIAVADDEVEHLRGELNAMLAFIEQLAEVDIAGVEPMTSVMPMAMAMRKDRVADGGIADAVLANAPAREDHFFLVPKVVE
jgi:aspartyl-tRNA(Asn)/glutamyl-tRNA(Gln) amidotransferase subunit C